MTDKTDLATLLDIVRHLTSALSSASLYAPEHPNVTAQLGKMVDSCRRHMNAERELLIARVDEELLYQGKPLGKSPNLDRLRRYFIQNNIGFLKVSQGVTVNELRQLTKVLLGKDSIESLSQVSSHLQIGAVDTPDDEVRPINGYEELTREEKQGLEDQFEHIAGKQTFDIEKVASLVAGFIEAFRRETNPFLALVPIRMQDEYTFTHSVDVGILNIAQAMSLGIEGPTLHDIGIAGMLHDVGKIFVDREILNKPGKLSDEEFSRIKQHPSRGAQYLMNQEGIPRLAIFSAYEHHMRHDLQGYPKPPVGWTPNICSEMTMISDTFDALRTRRTYKDAWDFSKVSGLMLSLAGTQLNPELTVNFLKLLAEMGEDLPAPAVRETGEVDGDELTGCSCSLENTRCG